MPCSGRCWAGSSAVGSDETSLRLLAESLANRLAPALPAGLRLFVDDRGILTISDERTRRIVTIGVSSVPGWDLDSVLVRVADALNDIATEVGEATTDHYEEYAEIEGGEIRLWFGLVPPGSPEGQWRNVLRELAPIPLSRLSG
jgi:hypothetical protein